MSEIDGLKKECLYSFPPNRLNYCGEKGSFKKFSEFLENPCKKNARSVKKILSSFGALDFYLSEISKSSCLPKFDEKVVRSYWIGNSLLDSFKKNELNSLVEKIKLKKPLNFSGKISGFVPHHSFHVLFVKFFSKKVKPTLKNLSNCLVLWGKILKTEKNGFVVDGIELEHSEKKGYFFVSRVFRVKKGFFDFGKGNVVSIHWNTAIEKLSSGDLDALKKYTLKNLNVLNNLKKIKSKELGF